MGTAEVRAVDQRGRVVFAGRKTTVVCGRCNAVQKVPATRSTFAAWCHVRDLHEWRFSEPYGMTCPACCAVVCPWVLDVGRDMTGDTFRSAIKTSVDEARYRGGQVTAARRASKALVMPDAGERTRKVK